MNRLGGIDTVTETTLETALDINGDLVGTGLNDVKIKSGIITEEHLADEITYGGDLILEGSVDLPEDWSIGGTTISTTAQELSYLNGSTATAGGILFGNGSKFAQNVTNLYWDNTNYRFGIGTNTPTSPLSVGASSQFQIDTNGDIIKLKNLTYSWPTSHRAEF